MAFDLGHKTTWKGKLRIIGRKKKLCLTGSKIQSRIWRDGVVIGGITFLPVLALAVESCEVDSMALKLSKLSVTCSL